ncbi:LysM peptidoglycan-binding domain-containing protein [Streptomyces sp. D2-8]|uniref:peptidoglycan-binding protein n=1 Tax=Streptomyces sp. D2-8 TaxID=2707767 RepID=UPI0035AF5EB6|nr:LysM peptidoglycan-binding domain-containing protein [Streptomyces sp. D2-8]
MEKTTQFYVVKTGDNLTKIAQRFHVTVDQIMAWNPQIKDRNKIFPDQRIRVAPPRETDGDGEYEPFPGADFFQPAVTSPIIEAMGYRLIEEECSVYSGGPDSTWSSADQKSYANWQRKLGFSGTDADGIPGRTSWNKLHVPAVYE